MAETIPELLVPVRAAHVGLALAEARIDQDEFRRAEQAWLEDNCGYVALDIKEGYQNAIKLGGIEKADAMLAGTMLGHRVVRHATEESDTYEESAANYKRNRAFPIFGTAGNTMWNTPEVLKAVFGEMTLVDALMEIRHDAARDGASFIIGFFALEGIDKAFSRINATTTRP